MDKIFQYTATVGIISLAAATPIFAQTSIPKFEIVTPGDTQTIYGNKIPVLFAVENFQLVDYSQNSKPATGQGHIHLWLDSDSPTTQSATKIIQDTYTFSDVSYGDHTLRAELVTNDHKSLVPQQIVTVNFKSAQIPSAAQESQTSGFDKKTATVILVVVALVIIAAWWYTKDEEEEEKPEKASKPKRKNKRKSKK